MTLTAPLPSGELVLDVQPDAVHWRHSRGGEGIEHVSITYRAQILSIVKSFSNARPRPDFYPWVSELNALRLAASVEPSDGRGFQIHIEGPDDTYLSIGCPVDLPGFAEVPRGFHVEYFSSGGEHIDVVYHSFRDAEGEGGGGRFLGFSSSDCCQWVPQFSKDGLASSPVFSIDPSLFH